MGRVSRWDRPPEPKDARWFVRLVGKVLICTGLLMFGFVAYQLWGTGIETARAQDDLEDQFAELGEAQATAAPTTLAPSTTVAPTTTVVATTAAASTTVPRSTTTLAPTTTLPPTTTLAPTTTVPPPTPLDYAYVVPGEVVGDINIESVGINYWVVQGVGREDLKKGPGHYPNTAFPGELGNTAIAGHRTTYGGPFDHLPEVQVGDPIVVTTFTGTYTYVMTGSEVVNPEDGYVINTIDPTKATLTLTTCTPRGTASQRYVLYAELDPARSSPVGPYVPRDADGGAILAGDDSPTVTPAPTVAETAPPTLAPTDVTTVPPSSTSTTVPSTTTTTTTTTTVPSAGIDTTSDDDAFGSHWFDDRAAIAQVLLWAAIGVAIVVGAYQLAKQTRNSWLGLGVGIVPFVIVLYFFYQNVNRLLPAAL